MKITIGVQPNEVFDRINSDIQSMMNCESTKSHYGSTMLVFSIPKNETKTWSSLYKQITEYVTQHDEIKEYILVETSLEEAFISTAT